MDNNKVMVNKDSMDNSKVMDSNLNRDSTGNSKAAMASHRHLRAPASPLRDSSREVTAANRAKTKDTDNKVAREVMANKEAREVMAREGLMLEMVEIRVADQVMVTTSPGTITRGETVLRPTGVAEDLTVEMTGKEGMTT